MPAYEHPVSSDGIASHGVAVTPNDSTDLPDGDAVLFIGTGGTLSVISPNGVTCAFTVADSTILPMKVARVRATGTAATNIVALYGI